MTNTYKDVIANLQPEVYLQLKESLELSKWPNGAALTPEQREQMRQLSEKLLEDMDLRWQMDQLAENLREAFPKMGWEQAVEFQGDDSLNLPESIQTFEDLADLDRLDQMLRNVA